MSADYNLLFTACCFKWNGIFQKEAKIKLNQGKKKPYITVRPIRNIFITIT